MKIYIELYRSNNILNLVTNNLIKDRLNKYES